MARQLKPQKVDVVETKTGSIDVFLNRNNLKFFAEFNGERFEHTSADDVKKWCRDQLEQNADMEWIPIIEITTSDGEKKRYPQSAEVHLSFKRFYVAKSRLGGWLQSDWELPRQMLNRPTFKRDENGKPHIGSETIDPISDMAFRLKSSHQAHYPDGMTFPHHKSNWVNGDKKITLLVYNEETWAALHEMVKALHMINDRIRDIVVTQKANSR